MQPYKDSKPIGEPELLAYNAEEYKNQIEKAFDKGADEVRVFKPTSAQLKALSKKQLKKVKKQFNMHYDAFEACKAINELYIADIPFEDTRWLDVIEMCSNVVENYK